MNDLTIQQQSQSSVSRERSALTTELAKMLSLVAPVTMSADQQTLWLASAVDSLQGIGVGEVEMVSLEVRRSVTRPSQIVPEIAKLVAEKRSRWSRIREMSDPPYREAALESPDTIRCTPEEARAILDEFGIKRDWAA